MNDTTTEPRWFVCNVRSPVSPKLGAGFSPAAPAWAIRRAGSSTVIVHNGRHAIRQLTQDEARAALEVRRPCNLTESHDVEQRYLWELHR